VDGAGSAYVTGLTSAPDFPTVAAVQTTLRGSSDAFVTKFSPTGTALVYSTYLGGGLGSSCSICTFTYGNAIAVDASGAATVTGHTNAFDFPVLNAYQREFAGGAYSDAFVTRFSPSGALVYSTYLGGTSTDESGNGVAVDPSGNAYVTGATTDSNFPVLNPRQTYQGGATSSW
jgi:hypothetical protein